MNIVEHAEIRTLLDQLANVSDALTSNEREMFAHLREKYAEPTQGAFDDKICLEVMLRNIGIRNSVGLKPNEATRKIDLPRN